MEPETATETLKLSKPAWLTLEAPDGAAKARIDIYKARRVLDLAAKQPDEDKRWEYILKYLAGELNVDATQLAQSTAIEFNEYICKRVVELNQELASKVSGMPA
jgi:hypothetical protein